MKKVLILLFSTLISFNSYGETSYSYYENGQIKSEVIYKDNKRDGKWTKWYENGQLKKVIIYKDGNLVSQTKYYNHGQ
ncbi:MAG: hypothetical protein QF447_07690, partial [Candidatus Thioglobus sp.]|nr:hypothetical protein [Candidatus Thioglobus sp.]